MPHVMTVSAESSATVEQVQRAFGAEEYWLDRVAALAGSAVLESFVVDADGAIEVRTVADLSRNRLPATVTKLIPGNLRLAHNETWKPIGDRRMSGELDFAAPGRLGTGHASASLEPTSNGSRLTFTATVEVKVPVLAARIEKHFGNQFAEQVPAIQRFTTTWISERASR
jgi:hypothetical protein